MEDGHLIVQYISNVESDEADPMNEKGLRSFNKLMGC